MNIFPVDEDPVQAALDLCNEHIRKMSLETVQILCTVSWQYGIPAPYLPTQSTGPIVKWAGETLGNWNWLIRHGAALFQEYTYRYHKIHESEAILYWLLAKGGRPESGNLTPFVQAMPPQYQQKDPIQAYRDFYRYEKIRFATWSPRAKPPTWWDVGVSALT